MEHYYDPADYNKVIYRQRKEDYNQRLQTILLDADCLLQKCKGGYDDVTREAERFETIYNCIYNSTYTWAWATRENLGLAANANLPYSTNLTYGNNAAAPTTAHIWGTNAIDKLFSTALKDAYGSSLSIESAKLTSDATGKEDYFKVDFTKANVFEAIKTDIGSNPKQDVPSTLTINCKDSYGHDVTITLKMVVKPRK